jgi:hypothetical protein
LDQNINMFVFFSMDFYFLSHKNVLHD